MANGNTTSSASIAYNPMARQLLCVGHWTTMHAENINIEATVPTSEVQDAITVNGSGITQMDTAGAWLLYKLITHLEAQGINTTLVDFDPEHHRLLELIENKGRSIEKPLPPPRNNPLYKLGEATVQEANQALAYISFIGELSAVIAKSIGHMTSLQWKLTLNTVHNAGLNALPIIGLLSFLIGIVLAYQTGVQLREYGAEIYIVDLLGIAILREFGPLITAIIVAGRTSSAFTAEIATMKMNEEVDALRTLGLTPLRLLAIPKVIGLIIAFPLLIMWANAFGILGGMIMSNLLFDLSFHDFMTQLKAAVEVVHFNIGMSKAPVFALLISSVGCFQGFQASGSADSVGKRTTKSVVQAIFLIIVADALFSILFSRFGL